MNTWLTGKLDHPWYPTFANLWVGPKTPGLIILEHELTPDTVQAFINAYPSMKANGWNTTSVTRLVDDDGVYQNSDDDDSPVSVDGILPYPHQLAQAQALVPAQGKHGAPSFNYPSKPNYSVISTQSQTSALKVKQHPPPQALQLTRLSTCSALVILCWVFRHLCFSY